MGRDREQNSDQEIDVAWCEEIKRRLAEIDAGTVELVPWQEVREELFSPANATA